MTRIHRGLVIPVTAMLALCLAGCKGPAGGASKPLTANSPPYIADVPIPGGFKYIDKRSEDRIAGEIRFVRHEYEGRSHPISVRNFYREQMPLSRWTQLSDVNTKGIYTITFEKQRESCCIQIEQRNILGFKKTVIHVTISRVDRSGAPPAK